MKRITQRLLLAIAALSLFAAGCSRQSPSVTAPTADDGLAPLVQAGPAGKAIPGSYIVVFKDGQTADLDGMVNQFANRHSFATRFRYRSAVSGFAATLSPEALRALREDPRVAYVEENQEFKASVVQSPATWGLDRIDQTTLALTNSYTYNATGAGVDAYIIDTGIRLTHADFGGRAITGFDAITAGGTAADGNGHGTHVAGTVGGTTYGVAKGVRLIAVRVLDNAGSGTTAGVISGVDWVTAHHTTAPAVANMSLGGGLSATLDAAVRASIADGITYAVAAGNSAVDASTQSPAAVVEALTVAASGSNDAFATFSNWGTRVDIIAPGVNITSAWMTTDAATNTISGTSMASPHVAGAAALYLEANPLATPAAVATALIAAATPNRITGAPTGTPNLLLFTTQGAAPPPPPPAAPAVPTLISPAANATNVSRTSVPFSWSAPAGATSYTLQVSTDSRFRTFAYNNSALTSNGVTLTGFGSRIRYYWRVSASNAAGSSAFSAARQFTTAR